MGCRHRPIAAQRNAPHILGEQRHVRLAAQRFRPPGPSDDRQCFKTHLRKLSPTIPTYVLNFRFCCPDGRQVWLEETAKGEFDATGRLLRIKGLTRDITERKELEEHKNVLIAELDHRVKNALAIVSVIASRTQETSRSMVDFVAALDGRIKSMATMHELLSYRRWQGIPLAELVRREVWRPTPLPATRGSEGSDDVLSAEAGQAIAMVFHELATNAAKFGALSATGGHVSVSWSHRRNGHAQSLAFRPVGGDRRSEGDATDQIGLRHQRHSRSHTQRARRHGPTSPIRARGGPLQAGDPYPLA